MATYTLRRCRQGERERATWEKHGEWPDTRCGGAGKEKGSGQRVKSIEKGDIDAEEVQERRKGEVKLGEACRMATYMMRRCRQGERVRSTCQKNREWPHTSGGGAGKEKGSGQLDRSTENGHIHAEEVQAR